MPRKLPAKIYTSLRVIFDGSCIWKLYVKIYIWYEHYSTPKTKWNVQQLKILHNSTFLSTEDLRLSRLSKIGLIEEYRAGLEGEIHRGLD